MADINRRKAVLLPFLAPFGRQSEASAAIRMPRSKSDHACETFSPIHMLSNDEPKGIHNV